MNISAVVMFCLAAITAGAGESPTREFSAVVVSRDALGTSAITVAHLYAAHGKVRIESAEMPDDFFLVDRDALSTLLVRAGQRTYMNARQSSPLTEVFVPIDTPDPCPQWQSAAEDARGAKGIDRWRCDRLSAAEFRTSFAGRSADRRFIDTRLHFPMKCIGSDGSSFTLEHVHESPQHAELFTVPRDYRLFDPTALVDRIKLSDVWAAPPGP